SPRLAPLMARADTAIAVWVIARPLTDLEALARAVAQRGGHIRHTSLFLNAVSAMVPGSSLRELAGLPDVRRVQMVGTYFRRPRPRSGRRADSLETPVRVPPGAQVRLGPAADTTYGPGGWAFRLLNIPAVHQLGVKGAGVKIAMLDAGFNTDQPLMAAAHVIGQRDFVYGDSIVKDQPGETQGEMAHGTGTWSLIAAQAPGQLYGAAPLADFLLAKTEYTPTETRIEEDHWVAGIEWAITNGAQIVSSSLGYLSFDNGFTYTPSQLNGDFAVTTIAADSAAARGVLVVVAVGNSGADASGRFVPSSMDTPADADSVVSVGAVDSLGHEAAFSSHGPTADGRIKPEVSGPGVSVTMAAIDTGLVRNSGTSFSTPLIAGIAALAQSVRGALPAVDLRRGLLMASSHPFAPNDTSGWGIPDALKLYAFPTGVVLTGPPPGPLPTVAPTLAWDAGISPPGTTPNTYRLHVWIDSTFQHSLLDTTIAWNQYPFPVGIHGGLRLFWLVVATSSLGVAESTAVRGPSLVPPWATQLTLAAPQGATIKDTMPTFVWQSPQSGAAGPFTYDVAIYPASRTPAQAVAFARGISDTTFRPGSPLEKNLPYRWRVVAHLGSDSEIVTSPGTFLVADQSAPVTTLLFQNFPNPFPNAAVGLSSTCIWFDVANTGDVRLEIFDLRGRLVRRLAPSAAVPAQLPAGRYGRPAGDAPGTCDSRFEWDGRDEQNNYVRAGVYVYRLTAPGFHDTRRIVFLGP
ncbi:MAG: S8 family serine peptidase, partial [Gemmatimonadales bacterium]